MGFTGYEWTSPADYLQRLADSAIGRGYKQLVVEQLAISPGDTILDLGCGPGADLVRFSEAVGPDGQLIGVDIDPDAVAQARMRSADLGNVTIVHSDIRATGLGDASTDRVHTDRVLQHVDGLAEAIGEVARVLRPGGRFVAAEPDWDTLVISGDLDVSRAYRSFVTEEVVRNAVVGRQLPRLLEENGFEVAAVLPVTAVFRDLASADQVLGLGRVATRAIRAGHLDAEAGDAWLTGHTEGAFFASATLFIVVAVRSPGDQSRVAGSTTATV